MSLLDALRNKLSNKVTYQAKPEKLQSTQTEDPVESYKKSNRQEALKKKIGQYGDKGYKPSNGRGVGY